jgi:hypothetical protein
LALAASMGCQATATGYVPALGDSSYGYRSIEIVPRLHRVTFSGNSNTSRQTAEDFTLLRAAELTAERDQSYFSVVAWEDDTSFHTTTTHMAPAPGSPPGTSGTTVTSTTIYPSYELIIKTLEEPPGQEELFVLDAWFLRKQLRERHGLAPAEVGSTDAARDRCRRPREVQP